MARTSAHQTNGQETAGGRRMKMAGLCSAGAGSMYFVLDFIHESGYSTRQYDNLVFILIVLKFS
jgi:hypothetical protein